MGNIESWPWVEGVPMNIGIRLLLIVLVASAVMVMLDDQIDATGYDLKLALNDTARVKVAQGSASMMFNWTLTNDGTASDENIVIDVSEHPSNWSDIFLNTSVSTGPPSPTGPPIEVLMQRGETIEVWLIVTPPANETNDTYWFGLIVHPKADPSFNVTDDVGVIIPQRGGFHLMLWNPPPGNAFKAIPPSTVTIRFALYNSGNGPDRFRIQGSSSREVDGWNFEFVNGVDEFRYTDELPPDPTIMDPHFIDVKVRIPPGTEGNLEATVTLNATSMFDPSFQRPSATATVLSLHYYNFQVYIHGPDKKEGVPGMNVTFEIEIMNSGNGPDTFTLQGISDRELNPGFVIYTVPSNITVERNESTTVTVIVEVPEEPPKKTYFLTVKVISSSRELSPVTKAFAVEVGQYFEIEISCEEPRRETDPGGNLEYELVVRNTGNGLDSIIIGEFMGVPQGWLFYIQPPEVTLLQNQNASVKAIVIVPSHFEDAPMSNSYTLTIRVNSSRSDAEAFCDLVIDISQFWRIEWMVYGYDITNPDRPVAQRGSYRPRPEIRLLNDTSVTVVLEVKNYGNGPDAITLGLNNDNEHLEVSISPDSFNLDRGDTQEVTVVITVPKDGRSGIFSFFLSAHSSDTSFITRVVPMDVEVVPVYNEDDFIALVYSDPLNEDYTFTYTADSEGGKVIDSRGRLNRAPGIDINSLMAVLDAPNGTVVVTLSCAEIIEEEGTEYWVYFVSKDHQLPDTLKRPKDHRKGVFAWTFSNQSMTHLGLWYSNGRWGLTNNVSDLDVSTDGNALTFTLPSRELRRSGVGPGSGFGMYAYAHTLTEKKGDEYQMLVAWDSAGLGAARPPAEFTNAREESPIPAFLTPLALAMATLITLALAGKRRRER
jgi:uncharacterized membrane protein